MWTWSRFRVILDAECGEFCMTHPLAAAIIEVDMCHLDRFGQ